MHSFPTVTSAHPPILILFVFGVPMTEKLMENIPEFALYKERTSVFFPWFPKAR